MYEALLELMRGRRSVRRFSDQPVPDPLLDKILEAARWAPSAGNRQAWRFVVVRDAATRRALRDAVDPVVRELVRQTREELTGEVEAYCANFVRFAAAPVVVAPIYRGVDLLRAGCDAALQTERALQDGLSSVSAAIQNLLLAAHALGLGACWMTGPLVARAALEDVLGVPPGWGVAALVPVGFAAEEAEPPRASPPGSHRESPRPRRGSGPGLTV